MGNRSIEDFILSVKNSYKTGVYGNIYQGIYINEIPYRFKKCQLFDGKATVYLPVVFQDMDEKSKKIKYPSVKRPQIIKTSDDQHINLCFSILEENLEMSQVDKACRQIKDAFLQIHMVENYLIERCDQNDTNIFSWFTYVKPTIDGSIYVQYFLTAVDGKAVLGMFHCPVREKEPWKLIMREIMMSFSQVNGEEK